MATWLTWQYDCHDNMIVMATWLTWQYDCHDNMITMTKWLPWQNDCMTTWLAWQYDWHDSMIAMTSYLPWQHDCLDNMISMLQCACYVLSTFTIQLIMTCVNYNFNIKFCSKVTLSSILNSIIESVAYTSDSVHLRQCTPPTVHLRQCY